MDFLTLKIEERLTLLSHVDCALRQNGQRLLREPLREVSSYMGGELVIGQVLYGHVLGLVVDEQEGAYPEQLLVLLAAQAHKAVLCVHNLN